LLTALYVGLTGRIIPSPGPGRRGPGKPPEATGAGLVRLAAAQVLPRSDDERHWPRAAPEQVGRPFPGCRGKASTTSASRPPGVPFHARTADPPVSASAQLNGKRRGSPSLSCLRVPLSPCPGAG
ncbi:MAG: hypothetical protein ACRDOH_25830, partial [Streptosporangiaceae bacterium]